MVFDVLSTRFASDRSAVHYETRVVRDLFRAGKDEEALSRAIRLKEKHGLQPAAESPPLPERETARQELSEMLASLAERTFAEGIRSGNSSTLSLSAEAMEQLSDLSDAGSSDKDAELLLKRSIALIRSGNREEGVPLLLELVGEQRTDTIGERAATLYAETMIGAYERKEGTAEDAEDSTYLQLPFGEGVLPRLSRGGGLSSGRRIRSRGSSRGIRRKRPGDPESPRFPGKADPGGSLPVHRQSRRRPGQGRLDP
jgi:hypothetical protein